MLKVHHIGYLVKNIDKSISEFEKLGYEIKQNTILDDYRKVLICFMEKDGYVVEMISPVSTESSVAGLIKKKENTAYHICYETGNIEREIERLCEENYVLCGEKHEAVAIDGKEVVFLMHPDLGMIELVEN